MKQEEGEKTYHARKSQSYFLTWLWDFFDNALAIFCSKTQDLWADRSATIVQTFEQPMIRL